METERAIEEVVRESYGRLLAYLASRASDLSSAEDALGEAFLEALKKWPEQGVPLNPCGWLLTVARRRLLDRARHVLVEERAEEEVRKLLEQAQQEASDPDAFPDDRLKLLFVCAHPAIDPSARTPLMLQTVFGIEAAQIAGGFLTSPVAMSQRLVRAKTKIRAAGIPFTIPEPRDLPERFTFVLEAIYAAFTAGSAQSEGTNSLLGSEALALARLAVHLLPQEPEARGLLALVLHVEARRPARFSPIGEFVPLLEQNPQEWNEELILEAEKNLTIAARAARPGRFQLEAAIQSIHAQKRITGKVEWQAIIGFYRVLLQMEGSIGMAIGLAAALSENDQIKEALETLDLVPFSRIQNHQPYWATRGHVLERAGRPREAVSAWQQALGLTEQEALRQFLRNKIAKAQYSST